MRRVWIGVLAIVGALTVTAAAAATSTNTISIMVPTRVNTNAVYNITIQGFSRKRAVAYLFVVYRVGCARSFAAEHQRAPKESVYYSVRGSFNEVSGWKSSSTSPPPDHACAYLVGRASGKLLARAHVLFQVH